MTPREDDVAAVAAALRRWFAVDFVSPLRADLARRAAERVIRADDADRRAREKRCAFSVVVDETGAVIERGDDAP